MTYRFTEALDDYTAVTSHPHSAALEALTDKESTS